MIGRYGAKRGTPIADIPTPAVLVDREKMEKNISEMSRVAGAGSMKLRPHAKTHKSVEIARLQIASGASGLTVAKMGEAEVMFRAGFTDICVAYPVRGFRVELLAGLLARGAQVSTLVDAPGGVAELEEGIGEACPEGGLTVLLKVDVGLGRCGVKPFSEECLELAAALSSSRRLRFGGILSHSGHAYAAASPAEVRRIGEEEAEVMIELASHLEEKGFPVEEVSLGATPTVRFSAARKGVTELRPGNYVFNDASQIALGSAASGDCALTVLASVVSAFPDGRAVLDAGSKTLGLDRGAHGSRLLTGYGFLLSDLGGSALDDTLLLEKLSEEHGLLRSSARPVREGRKLRIIPHHACAVMNLTDAFYLVDSERVVDILPVDARGRVI